MANVRNVYQQLTTVSIPKQELSDWASSMEDLSKDDLRVFMMLLTVLNGYSPPKTGSSIDPNNYCKINEGQIATELYMSEKRVKKSIKRLLNEGIIEKGNSSSVKNGYRFTF